MTELESSTATIKRVARDLFSEHGFDATTMQEIADAAGLHKSSLYHHYRSKEALLEAVCLEVLDLLDQSLQVALAAPEPSLRERFLAAFDGAVTAALDDPATTNVILSNRGSSDFGRLVQQRRRSYEQGFVALAREAQEAGEIRSDIEPELLVRLVLGMVNWAVTWFDPARYTATDIRRAVSKLAAEGI